MMGLTHNKLLFDHMFSSYADGIKNHMDFIFSNKKMEFVE